MALDNYEWRAADGKRRAKEFAKFYVIAAATVTVFAFFLMWAT